MIWLILSIFASAGLFIIFKLFNRFQIDVLPAIVVNYLTCFITGNILLGNQHIVQQNMQQEGWFIPAICMGLMFIIAFNLMGSTTRHAGASAASVASKMSVVIPAIFAIIYFHEKFSVIQYFGMVISLISVYLMVPKGDADSRKKGKFMLAMVFLTSGLVDTGLNMIRHQFSDANAFRLSTTIFGSAAILGVALLLFQRKKHSLGKKEVLGGILLGIVNFFSLVFMFNAMAVFHSNTAWFLAVNNIGVVTVSTILAAIFFKEKMHNLGIVGLAVAGLALVFMNYNAFF